MAPQPGPDPRSRCRWGLAQRSPLPALCPLGAHPGNGANRAKKEGMKLGWGKGHLQVCTQHPQRCGGRGRPGRQPPKGESLLEYVAAPTSSVLSPPDQLLDNTSIILKISLLPSGLPELIGEQRWLHSTPLSVRKGIPTLCVNLLPSSK